MHARHRFPSPVAILAAMAGLWSGTAAIAAEPLPGGLPGAGLVATVGLAEADALADLAAGGRRLVHAFVPADRVPALRGDLLARGVAGYVVVDALVAGRLPYGDDQLDAVLVLPGAEPALADQEAVRATAPFGVTARRTATGWAVAIKPRRDGQADWRSFYGDAAQNPRSADGSGPVTMPLWISQSGNTVWAGMRVEGPFAVHPTGQVPDRPSPIIVRRAFSGVPVAEFAGMDRRLITLVGGKVVFAPGKDQPLALYDIAAGATMALPADLTALPAKDPQADAHLALLRVVPLDDGGFLTAVAGRIARFNPDGTVRWAKPTAGLHMPVCAGGLVIGVVGEARSVQFQDRVVHAQGLRALRLDDGATAWDSPAAQGGVVRRFYGADQGVIGFLWLDQEQAKKWHGRSNTLTLIETATGKVRWEKPGAAVGVTLDTLVTDRELVVSTVNTLTRYALADGSELGRRAWTQWNCQEVRASADWLLSGMTFIGMGGDQAVIVPKGITRTACNVGIFPANRLIYTTGTNCTCYDQWRGNAAFAAEPPIPVLDDRHRLQPGKAAADAGTAITLSATGWPTWMADNRRGGGVEGQPPRQGVLRWRTRLAGDPLPGPIAGERRASDTVDGRISQAVIAAGTAFVAIPDEHRIVALDLGTGSVRWSFGAGGRIDGPPTVAGGMAFFGSRDGWVYALDAASGALRWRSLVAPALRSIVADGHIESAWPVPAPVVVHDGGVFAAAGVQSGLQHGLTAVRLDAASGRTVWRSPWYSGDARGGPDGRALRGYSESINDVLQIAGPLLCLGYRAFDPATGEQGPIRSDFKESRFANDRNSYATLGDRRVPLTWVANSRLGMLSDGGAQHPRTYDGIAARFLALDQARGRIYSLHGAKMRGSGGTTSSRTGDLDAWPIGPDGRIADGSPKERPDVARPSSLWKQSVPDGKDGYPARIGLIRIGETLAILERNGFRKGEPKHAVALHAAADGSLIARLALPEAPIVNGLSSDGRVLLVALADGSLACLADP